MINWRRSIPLSSFYCIYHWLFTYLTAVLL